MKKRFILQYHRAPGDTLVMTALVRDLKLTYEDDILVDVITPYPDIWRHNPYLTPLDANDPGVKVIRLDKKGDSADRIAIGESQRKSGRHYLQAFHRYFTKKTSIPVDLLFAKPDIHLTDEEKATPLVGGPYWIICPGFKLDITNKSWHMSRWTEVVSKLRGHGFSFIQEGVNKPRHVNVPVEGTLNLINQTSIRDLARNVYHSQGVICLCSLSMHLAAALEKPCVVIFGGREEPSHEWYRDDPNAFGPKCQPPKVPHALLHTMGKLPCCGSRGCWLRRTVRLNDGRKYDSSICKMPDLITSPKQPVAKCMSLIEVDQVVEAVLEASKR